MSLLWRKWPSLLNVRFAMFVFGAVSCEHINRSRIDNWLFLWVCLWPKFWMKMILATGRWQSNKTQIIFASYRVLYDLVRGSFRASLATSLGLNLGQRDLVLFLLVFQPWAFFTCFLFNAKQNWMRRNLFNKINSFTFLLFYLCKTTLDWKTLKLVEEIFSAWRFGNTTVLVRLVLANFH